MLSHIMGFYMSRSYAQHVTISYQLIGTESIEQ